MIVTRCPPLHKGFIIISLSLSFLFIMRDFMIKMVLELKKFDVKEQELINRALKKLERQITTFESTGTPFEKIFNNDAIKYDILGKGFYTYKFVAENSSQLRILYRFVRNDNGFDLECHKVEIKRRSGKGYIKDFEEYVKNYE